MTILANGRSGDIDRASNADLAFLAMGVGRVPEQFAVVLVMDGVVDARTAEQLLDERVRGVPRLRQRLVRTPPGCGPAIWIDDDGFDVRRHLRAVRCAQPGDDAALLDTVLPLVMQPLPRDRPLWRAAFVDGLAAGGTALVLVVHHVLADGLGGLAVLDQLVDGRTIVPGPAVPHRPPPIAHLAADALSSRLRAVREIGVNCRRLRSAMAAGGGMSPARAEPCSLIARTGDRRSAATVRTDLAGLRENAHRYGATVNAALLTAVAGALSTVLEQRGEKVPAVVVAVPVAGHRAAGAAPGNAVSPLLVTVPTAGSRTERITRVADVVRRRRELATGPAPIALLGAMFRLVAALGGYRWYMQRQRRLHTVVSYVRGPEQPVRFGGVPVRAMIPLVVGGNTNITVSFQALSYAGSLTVTAVADPDRCPDLPLLARSLRQELAALTHSEEQT